MFSRKNRPKLRVKPTAGRPRNRSRNRLIKPYRAKLALMGFFIVVAFVTLWVRLFYVQVLRHAYYVKKAEPTNTRIKHIMPGRGIIYDSDGAPIAINHFLPSVYVEPGRITKERPLVAAELAEMFDLDAQKVLSTLEKYKDSKACVPIARQVRVEQAAEKLRRLRKRHGLSLFAVDLRTDNKREYPCLSLAAHLVGGVQMDDFGDRIGYEGIEKQYDEELRGKMDEFEVIQRNGETEPVPKEAYMKAFGNDVVLTIDSEIQRAAERALQKGITEQRGLNGAIVVMACRDIGSITRGSILAMASYPTFDANVRGMDFTRINHALRDELETGSVMKTFMAAVALEKGIVDLDTIVDCQNGVGRFNGVTKKDTPDHRLGLAPFRDVFKYSSNVGTVAVVQGIDPVEYRDWLLLLGFGRKTGIDLPAEANGVLNLPMASKYVARDSMATGYGIQVTPIQVVAALSVIGSGGLSVRPHLMKEIRGVNGETVTRYEPDEGHIVLDRVTARKVWELMEGVVVDGTGTDAQIPGYRIGGKTGTARKWDPVAKEYSSEKYRASFAALAPIDEPKVAVYCFVDEPVGKYGGTAAAPIVKGTLEVALRRIGIFPSKTDEKIPRDTELIVNPIREKRHRQAVATLVRGARDVKVMPDLTGLTIAEALEVLHRLPLVDYKIQGSGFVVSQKPEPNEPLKRLGIAEVTFARNPDKVAIARSEK